MQPLVSVIVPVYKVEEYLIRCLESLRKQSLNEIEILLIDDASPDRSGKICEQYAAKDNRFKVTHHTDNKGLSAARNTGIKQAIADYLMFVDSDDWVEKNFCKYAYECAVDKQADLVMFGYQHIQDIHVYNAKNEIIKTVVEGLKSRVDAINLSFTEFGMVAWNKLYHRNLFKNILYPEGQIYEDTATTYKLIWKATRIYCLDVVLYYYFRRPDSISKRKRTKKVIREQFQACWKQCCDLSKWGFRSSQHEMFKINLALFYCVATPINFSDPYYVISANVIRSVKKSSQAFTWKQRILILLFKFSPKLFNLLCLLWNKHVQ